MNKIKSWYRLIETRGIGNAYAHRLIRDIGDPEAFVGKKTDLLNNVPYLNDGIKRELQIDIDPPNWKRIASHFENNSDLEFISCMDERFPDTLKEIYYAPLFITAIGDTNLLNSSDIISIVGTRKPTHYGRSQTEKIVESLILNNFIVCSGLALGIDSIAHRKTLEISGITIAVLAGGLDNIYPPQNKELANLIADSGLIISESLPTVSYEKYHFHLRNRIISGLSRAVCVIEGNSKSGALVTAKFALEQGKEIYALPGDITRVESHGPNLLLTKGAKPLLSPGDIASDFSVEYLAAKPIPKAELTTEELEIFEIIKAHSQEMHIDMIVMQTAKSIGEISSTLFMLELKNAIKMVGSSKYIINY